ncbi:hypothetical protein SAMN04488498_11978 [Mesorhizobium albiziae]|uniref:Uncharacterized protein n=1 Tax=Neomesorhizobium albiziae TaxID=335020 RepID=A0A1I4DSK6_9HYPH|nr:hypothetical protein [Mesorhizobium albiziae]GLS33754.1 hypothetical protein GCM10007937_54660 [Mesorhizobium albiziae]SFK96375.1 hypothetical protein SAMN04488498_11978 [Mesorhizobium albiziae]
MTIRDVIRRLAVAEATINPANSMGARLKRLTQDQRATYDQWRELRAKWTALFDEPDALYAAIINGNSGPQLPESFRDILFDPPPQISTGETETQINDKWQRFSER